MGLTSFLEKKHKIITNSLSSRMNALSPIRRRTQYRCTRLYSSLPSPNISSLTTISTTNIMLSSILIAVSQRRRSGSRFRLIGCQSATERRETGEVGQVNGTSSRASVTFAQRKPKPQATVPEPGPTPPTRHREVPLAQGEADPEGRGRDPFKLYSYSAFGLS